jgi:hypothetical protein
LEAAEGPASEEAITVRAPDVELAAKQASATDATSSSDAATSTKNDEPSKNTDLAAQRDSVIPVESRDFVADDSPRQRRLPKAPTRSQAPKADKEWLDELPMSVGTPTLAALVQRAHTESEKPAAPSIPPELLAERTFDLGGSDWDSELVPALRKPNTDAPVVSPSVAPKAASSNRRSTVVVLAAVAAAAFAAGLSVRRSAPVTSASLPVAPHAAEATPNVQPAKPAAAPPEFAIEPAAPEQSPAALPLAEGAPRDSAHRHEPAAAAAAPASVKTEPPTATAPTPPPSPSPTTASLPNAANAPSPAPPTPKPEAPAKAAAAPEQPAAPKSATAEAVPGEAAAEPAFDTQAAEAAIGAAASRAASCKQPGDPSGMAVVTITFSPTGRATTANVAGPPFAGTPTGGCIAATLRGARVPPFSGDFVTVKKSVKID